MILKQLYDYYDLLAKRCDVPHYGWSLEQISFGLNLDANGALIGCVDLRRKKLIARNRWGLVPQIMEVPMRTIRTTNCRANFLWDNPSYLLGLAAPPYMTDSLAPNTQLKLNNHSFRCFETSRRLHQNLLAHLNHPGALAIIRFFHSWKPEQAGTYPALQPYLRELAASNAVFMINGHPAIEDDALRAVWPAYYEANLEGACRCCLVTGQYLHIASLHPKIRGVFGAAHTGSSLVSFNQEAFSSWGHEKGYNAPISDRAAFACSTALNYLTTSRYAYGLGGVTFVFWTSDGRQDIQEAFFQFLTGGDTGSPDLSDGMFCLLGLSTNGTRLSVCFWSELEVAELLGILRRCEPNETDIRRDIPTLAQLLLELEPDTKYDRTQPVLAVELMQCLMDGRALPGMLMRRLLLRLCQDETIRVQYLTLIVIYLKQNKPSIQIQEALQMELNAQSDYLPYILGRLFAVYDLTNRRAVPHSCHTVKQRYFRVACTAPARIFPDLERRNDVDLHSLKASGWNRYWETQKLDLMTRIREPFPQTLRVEDMGVFTLGYYHQLHHSAQERGVGMRYAGTDASI
ncbi:MAG: type CRISPR-associated protein Cas8c/Csd1 [Oscillospiraceae bacterium]|nr:type CRISPR-associated protein Cas8c/Csd1 [Oscillospiraceae bacterium]